MQGCVGNFGDPVTLVRRCFLGTFDQPGESPRAGKKGIGKRQREKINSLHCESVQRRFLTEPALRELFGAQQPGRSRDEMRTVRICPGVAPEMFVSFDNNEQGSRTRRCTRPVCHRIAILARIPTHSPELGVVSRSRRTPKLAYAQ